MTMLAQRMSMPRMHATDRPWGATEGYVYFFDLVDRAAQPDEKLLDMVLQNHDLNWAGFIIRDAQTGCGMLWLSTRRG